MDKLLNAAIDLGVEARKITGLAEKLGSIGDNVAKLRQDIDQEKAGRQKLESMLSELKEHKLLEIASGLHATYDRIKIWNAGIWAVFGLYLLLSIWLVAEFNGVNVIQYLRGGLTPRQKIAAFEELTGESVADMPFVLARVRKAKGDSIYENMVLMHYLDGKRVGILEPIEDGKKFKLKRIYYKNTEEICD